MAKLGGGVDELQVNLLKGPAFGLHQQGLAESEHSLFGSHHTAFQHDEIIGHFTIMDKATQRVDALVRQVIISGGVVLDQLAILNEVALANLIDLLVDLGAVMVAFLPSPGHGEGHSGRMPRPIQATLRSPRWVLRGSFLVCQRLVTPL